MGTSTLSAKQRAKRKVDKVIRKDQETTTSQLGFRVTGYIIKDQQGQIIEKVVKPHGLVKVEHIPGILQKVLKSNGTTEVNLEALAFFKSKAQEMLEYFRNQHSMSMQCSSILMIVDNINK